MAEDIWAPEEPERAGGSSRFANPKNWIEVKEGKRLYQKFRFRVLGAAISGALAWSADNKPFRFRAEKDIPADFNWRLTDKGPHAGKPELPKSFWAFPVWDYEAHEVKVFEATQKAVRDGIRAYATNPEWGSPLGYDLTATREGKGFDTKYAVIASPKSAVDVEAANAFNDLMAAGFNLDRLFDGGDPFSAPAAAPAVPAAQDSIPF